MARAMLNEKFFDRNTKRIARELLGKILVCGRCEGKIVETEAYLGEEDPGARGRREGPVPHPVLGPPGTMFVYFTYGNHWMFNIVTEREGKAGAVLIRAVEPVKGIELMKRRRKTDDLKNLCNGPGKFTQAFGIDKRFNEKKLGKDIYVKDNKEKFRIVTATRIGLSKGHELPLRFYIKDNEFVSRK